MVGYIESLTDPSYSGQILSLTYPIIGNYGVPDKNIIDEFGIPKYFESEIIQTKGLVIHSLSSVASHWSCVKTLDEWLYEEKIPGIYDIDTRELTKIIRQKGVMMGVLTVSDKPIDKIDFKKMINVEYYNTKNFMSSVSSNVVKIYGKTENKVLVLLDTGTKYSIISHLLRIGFKVVQVPWDSTYEKILTYNPVGVIISNGPGDPKMCKPTIETAKKLIMHGRDGQFVEDNGIDAVERCHQHKPVSNLTLSARLGYGAYDNGGRGSDRNCGDNRCGDGGDIEPHQKPEHDDKGCAGLQQAGAGNPGIGFKPAQIYLASQLE